MGPPPPPPALSLHSTPLFDLHLDASHAVPPVMSMAPARTRAAQAWRLDPGRPRPNPTKMADVHPDDGPLVAPPTLLTAAAS